MSKQGLLSVLVVVLAAAAPADAQVIHRVHVGGPDICAALGLPPGCDANFSLVALEFALTIVLLIGAGLLIKSLWRLSALPDGFNPDRIVTMDVRFFGPAYREEDARRAHAAEVLRRVSTVPPR